MRAHVTVFLMVAVGLVSAFTAQAEEIKSVNAFYFGNSYTGNTMPGLQPLLAESAGREWSVQVLGGPGMPPWTHMMRLVNGAPKFAPFHSEGPESDVLVILIYGNTGLSQVATGEKWGHKFNGPTDIGDVASCSYLIREYLKLNPSGRAYIYTAWPGIPAAGELRKRINQGKSREERRKPTHEEMEPLRKSFDYEAAWLTQDYIAEVPEGMHDRIGKYLSALRPTLGDVGAVGLTELVSATGLAGSQVTTDIVAFGCNGRDCTPQELFDAVEDYRERMGLTHSRRHMYLTMNGIIESFPELWRDGRLGMVPVGDVFMELDRKMKADKVPGLVNVGEFSADGGHLRSGLPRYVLAATHYAVLFRDHPKHLDWRIFQDRSNYESKKFGFYVHQPDLGVHIDITPERAAITNDVIWEVVNEHPYTRIEDTRS